MHDKNFQQQRSASNGEPQHGTLDKPKMIMCMKRKRKWKMKMKRNHEDDFHGRAFQDRPGGCDGNPSVKQLALGLLSAAQPCLQLMKQARCCAGNHCKRLQQVIGHTMEVHRALWLCSSHYVHCCPACTHPEGSDGCLPRA